MKKSILLLFFTLLAFAFTSSIVFDKNVRVSKEEIIEFNEDNLLFKIYDDDKCYLCGGCSEDENGNVTCDWCVEVICP